MRVQSEIAPLLQSDRDVQRIVTEATSYLNTLGWHPAIYPELEATADLRVLKNTHGVPVMILEIHNNDASTVRAFYPDQMPDASVVRLRIGEMWQDLLGRRSRKQLARIRESVSQMGEND